MQVKRILSIISSVAALSFATNTWAVMSIPYGWYLEGYLGSTKISGINYPGSSSSSGLGGGGNVGYKFMPYIAAEAGYTQYANTSIKNSAGTKAATDKHYSYDLAAKGILPIYTTGLEIFGKLGIERNNAKISVNNQAAASALGIGSSNHSTTSVYVGAGAEYYMIPELAVVVQWARAQGNSQTGNLDLFSGGLNFIFG